MARLRVPQEKVRRFAILLNIADGHTQAETARLLGLSEGAVSTVVKNSENIHYRRSFTLTIPEDDADLALAHELLAAPTELESRLNALSADEHRVGVRVVSSTSGSVPQGADEITRAFTEAAKRPVLSLMTRNVRICGVTWGQTVGGVVQSLERQHALAHWKGERPLFVPLCGDTLDAGAQSLNTSTALAERLRHAVGSHPADSLSLAMLPAFIPSGFSPAEEKTIWKLISLIPAHASIFARGHSGAAASNAYARRLDMVLTSVSVDGFALGDRRDAASMPPSVQGKIVADIGGVLLENDGLTPPQRAVIRKFEARMTGVNRDELAACAQRAQNALNMQAAIGGRMTARSDGRAMQAPNPRTAFDAIPGVVVVARGASKARAIVAAVKARLLNQLVIDRELETELLSLTQVRHLALRPPIESTG